MVEIVSATGTQLVTLRKGIARASRVMNFDTRAEILTTNIDPAIVLLRTAGYAAPGDGGHASYKRYTGTPVNSTNPGNAQSLDGQWWRLVLQGPLPTACFGTKGDFYITNESDFGAFVSFVVNPTPTDNYQAVRDAISFASITHQGNSSTAPLIQFGYGAFYISDGVEIERHCVVEGLGTGNTEGVSSTLLIFPAGKGGFRWRNNISQPFWSSPTIRRIAMRSLGYGGQTTAHGLTFGNQAMIEFVSVQNFGGDGIHIAADVTGGTNANGFFLNRAYVLANAGDGVYCQGGDANAGCGIAVQAFDNLGWGIRDISFLANGWLGCQADHNGIGAYCATDLNASVTFTGCYSEGTGKTTVLAGKSMIIGGTHAEPPSVSGGAVQLWGNRAIGGWQLYPPAAELVGHVVDLKEGMTKNTYWELTDQGATVGLQYIPTAAFGDGGGWWANNILGQLSVSFGYTGGTGGRFRDPPTPSNIQTSNRGIFLGAFGASHPSASRWIQMRDAVPDFTDDGARLVGDTILDIQSRFCGWRCTANGGTYQAWTNTDQPGLNNIRRNTVNRLYRLTIHPGGFVTSTVQPVHTSGTVTGADGLGWTYISDYGADATWIKSGANFLEGSIVYDAPSIAAGANTSGSPQSIPVPGVIFGDHPVVDPSGNLQGLHIVKWISATGTSGAISFYLDNKTANPIDLGSMTFYGMATKRTI